MRAKQSERKTLRKKLRETKNIKQIAVKKQELQDTIPKKKKAIKVVDSKSDILDEDDKEIARLEKLLGIKKGNDRIKSAAKLNREYEQFEGISGNFGDFLIGLDSLTERLHDRNGFGSSQDIQSEDMSENAKRVSDNEVQMSSDDEEDVEDRSDMDESNNIVDSEVPISDIDGIETYYRPIKGEDIYGRQFGEDTNNGSITQKYIPPAARSQVKILKEIESSENMILLRRQINGLMNRLSDQSKDSILKGLQSIFNSNSIILSNQVLKESIIGICNNSTQLLTSLIPIYASTIAALHFTVGIEVGAFIVESIVDLVIRYTKSQRDELSQGDQNTKTAKSSLNYLLLLLYLYNFRILHHDLIFDILNEFIGNGNSRDSFNQVVISEFEIESTMIVVEYCGFQLRSDDPVKLKAVISHLISSTSNLSKDSNCIDSMTTVSGRCQYLIESINDLKNNKSKRTQNSKIETIKSLRKWIGNVKTNYKSTSANHLGVVGDGCLRISLDDILNAEYKGRWWKAGASWKGNSGIANNPIVDENQSAPTRNNLSSDSKSSFSEDEIKLQKLCEKLRMNTPTRKRILCQMMASRDVQDAFERISKLDLKGKQDRDIIQVIIESCASEKMYNPFYSELLALFCSQNRQIKVSLQYVYWDLFRVMKENPLITVKSTQRSINLAQLLASIVSSFYVSITILKVIDVSSLNDNLKAFLNSFFLYLFSNKVEEKSFQLVFDRIATSTDFTSARDTILVYLQTIFKSKSTLSTKNESMTELSNDDLSLRKSRKRLAISTLQSMKVLDFANKKI